MQNDLDIRAVIGFSGTSFELLREHNWWITPTSW